MSQIIIIDNAEALAIQIERELIKHSCDAPVVDSIISCLHPIEVPSEAEELVNKVREYINCNPKKGGKPIMRLRLTDSQCARLIESYSRRVPRAMLREVYNLSSIEWERSADAIAAKYGVKVEGR